MSSFTKNYKLPCIVLKRRHRSLSWGTSTECNSCFVLEELSVFNHLSTTNFVMTCSKNKYASQFKHGTIWAYRSDIFCKTFLIIHVQNRDARLKMAKHNLKKEKKKKVRIGESLPGFPECDMCYHGMEFPRIHYSGINVFL